jgi:hypothetical protein
MRLGKEGYMRKVDNQMSVASYLRSFIGNLTHPNGQKRFQLLDGGDVSAFQLLFLPNLHETNFPTLIQTCCLPVVSARLNPELGLHYDDKDLQHALSESHWYESD